MIEVLVVDDSPVVRDFLKYVLEEEPGVRVIGTAENGRKGVELVRQRRPDVVTMDIHMPVMDGFEATREIMETAPVPIVIVSASWDKEEVDKAFSALEAGAVAALEKPRGMGHPDSDESVRELVQTVKLMAEVKVVKRRAKVRKETSAQSRMGVERAGGTVELVAVGASTGGPQALQAVLGGLSADFPAPVLIVQHIAVGFLQGLADWLGQASGLDVRVAGAGDRLRPGRAYLAPDGFHMGVDGGERIALSRSAPEHSLRPAVSFLFRSVAEVFGQRGAGVLLTGMGKDGAQELKLMRDRGAVTIAQDRESSVVHGMPGEAIKLGGAGHVLPPDQIGPTLEGLVRQNARYKS